MPVNAAVGTLSQANISYASFNGGVPIAFEYRSCSLGMHQEIISTDGLRGTHNHPSERTRIGRQISSGSLSINPGSSDIDCIMPLVMGTIKNGSNQFPFTETLLLFQTVVDRVTKVATYATCYVDHCTIRGSEGEPLELELGIEALTETIGASGTFTGSFNNQSPFVFMDGVLTYGGSVYQFKTFDLTIANNLKKDRFMNSVTRTDLPFMDRMVSFNLMLPYTTDTQALYATGVTLETISMVFTNGAKVLTLNTSGFQAEPASPPVPGRNELLIPLHGQARTTGATASLTITNV